MTAACLECHEPIRAHIDLKEGLHGTLSSEQARQCGLCHSDHHGEGFSVVNLQSFRQAGIEDPETFDHERIGWVMQGKHLEQACSKCHTNAYIGVLPEGTHRYLGLDQDCSTCHEDAHEGRMKLACAECHGQEDFQKLHAPGHERFLPLIGGHGDVECRTCHAQEDAHSLESIGERVSLAETRNCRDCHEDPHTDPYLDAVSETVGLKVDAACVTCHLPEHTEFRAEEIPVSPELHALSGFSLAAPHDAPTCAQCHAPELEAFAERYPGRDPDTCSGCHEDVHAGQFATGPFSEGDCIACHERERFLPHTLDAEDHRRTALVLDGAHLPLACEECHLKANESVPRVFRGTPSDCDGCHEDSHGGFFAPHAPALDSVPHGMCASCHSTETFSDPGAGVFDHGSHTGFPIEGAHAEAQCEACHPRSDAPDEFGRTFGHVTQLFGRVEGCQTCHADPHEGEFDEPGLPRSIEGRAGCARCHTTTSFRTLIEGWDHRRWTGFGLEGAHGKEPCSACHKPIRAPQGAPGTLGRTWERAPGNRCADCHEDSHNGQFDLNGFTSCERCHESAKGFEILDFNHEIDSRFPLGEAHRKVPCDDCHLPVPPETPNAFVIYRPMEMDCVACHGTHEGPTLKRRPK